MPGPFRNPRGSPAAFLEPSQGGGLQPLVSSGDEGFRRSRRPSYCGDGVSPATPALPKSRTHVSLAGMKLYYAFATCSHAPHIALREAGLPFELVRFDMKARALDGGAKLEDVNEKGFVPVLELDDGQRLTEVAVILQYIADLAPEKRL